MDWISSIAEEKILESMRNGEFERLPGAGKPLKLEDDSMVPEELRVGFKLLKNAGVIPEEMQLRKDILTLKDLLACCRDSGEQEKLRGELSVKKLRYQTLLADRGWASSGIFEEYERKIQAKLTEK
jgi:hypothetical protein